MVTTFAVSSMSSDFLIIAIDTYGADFRASSFDLASFRRAFFSLFFKFRREANRFSLGDGPGLAAVALLAGARPGVVPVLLLLGRSALFDSFAGRIADLLGSLFYPSCWFPGCVSSPLSLSQLCPELKA